MLPQWQQEIKDASVFKKLYLFTFNFAKTTGQKSMDVDVSDTHSEKGGRGDSLGSASRSPWRFGH